MIMLSIDLAGYLGAIYNFIINYFSYFIELLLFCYFIIL
jgi:hypothetical protein